MISVNYTSQSKGNCAEDLCFQEALEPRFWGGGVKGALKTGDSPRWPATVVMVLPCL